MVFPALPRPAPGEVSLVCTRYKDGRALWGGLPDAIGGRREGGAIVLGDGTMEGFVGGECAEATVRRESLETLPTGEAVLLRITPSPAPDQPGKKVVPNPCL